MPSAQFASTPITRMPGAAFRIGMISASPVGGERIGSVPAPWPLLLGWRTRIALDPIRTRFRETRLGTDHQMRWDGCHPPQTGIVMCQERGV